jgi:hypothetical protein
MDDQNFENTGDEAPDITRADGTAPEADSIPTDRRPLGFWLRVVDGLISREFDSALAEEGVTRRDWMLLNALSGDVDPALAERLARRPKRLRGLEKRGWADEKGDGTWLLTDQGRAAAERLGGIVDGIRSRVAGAVSPEDFATMTASLEAIARELGWDESASPRDFGRGRFFGPRFGTVDEPRFGRRPGFGPGFRPGSGPGFGPGFPPGFRGGFGPGFDPRRAWAEAWDDEDGWTGWHHHGGHPHGHHGPRGFGWGPAWGFDPQEHHAHHGRGHHGHDAHHGHHGHDTHHGHHGKGSEGKGRDRRASQEAYERGFDAGYSRGAAERG